MRFAMAQQQGPVRALDSLSEVEGSLTSSGPPGGRSLLSHDEKDAVQPQHRRAGERRGLACLRIHATRPRTWTNTARRPAFVLRHGCGGQGVDRNAIEALIARERPGWRVVEVTEVNDESGPSFIVILEKDGQCRTVLISEAEDVEDQG